MNKVKTMKVFNKNRNAVKKINLNHKANKIYSLHRVQDNHRLRGCL